MSEQGKTISRDELYEAVWQTPISRLAAAWNVLPVNIVKACERMNVPRPEPGHWAMVRRGWEVTKEALPAAIHGTPTSTMIGTPQRRTRAAGAPAERATRPKASTVKVPSDLRNAHPEIRKMKQRLADGYTDATGLVHSLRRMKVLRVKVSKGQIDRALRIADAIIKAVEARGAKLVMVSESDIKEIQIDGERIESVLIEETKRVRREKRDSSPFAREWEFRATGRLRFDIDQYTPVGGQKSWIDGERHSLEEQLGEIVDRLFEVVADLKKWRADQVHGMLSSNFVRKLNYPFLEDYLLLVVDATEMPTDFREDFFMTSRDRLAEVEDRDFVEAEIREFLKSHDGLRLLNNKRKEEAITKSVEADEPLDLLQELINEDPTLAALFGTGDKLKVPYGKQKQNVGYTGKRFPTYFRLKKENLVKDCPINRTCRVEFETDAVDDYFSRGDDPGRFEVIPPNFNQGYRLYHGTCSAKFCPPINSEVGDVVDVEVRVTDAGHEVTPFVCKFKVRVTAKELAPEPEERPHKPKEPAGGGVSLPRINEVMRPQWPQNKFTEHTGLKFTGGVNGDPLEAFVNMENLYLTNELARAKDDAERVLLRHYFKNGLVLVALGILQEAKRQKPETKNGDELERSADDQLAEDLGTIFRLSGGIAAVIIPVVRSLAATAAKATN